MHTTKDIAARLGVNAQTIRRWTDEHGKHMSPGSQISDQRIFTDDDFLLLWSIRRWRQLGYSLDEIGERLGNGERISDAPPAVQSPDEVPRAIMVSEAVHTAALAEIHRLEADRERLRIERDSAMEKRDTDVSTLNSKINGLEREIGELRGQLTIIEKDRRPAMFWLAVLGLAVVLAVVITAILLLAGRGG